MFSALSKSLKSPPTRAGMQRNIIAGITVGVIALPLSMALAIASGVPPQHGLYTAMVAGVVIALTGGSKVNISGPTAAFVVVLLPIVQQYGIGGLLVSGFMAGIILILMGLARMGRLIEIVPYPVTVGFTAGIGVVIAGLQIKDFLGLDIDLSSGHFIEKLWVIIQSLPNFNWQESLIGIVTLVVLIIWGRFHSRIPGHLVALLFGTFLAGLFEYIIPDFSVATIGTRFHYAIGGLSGSGIPPILPAFDWPWNLPNAEGQPIGLSYELVNTLLASAITIAVLGSLESLLCAVIGDGMSGKKHNPNDELIGQGLGNMVAPLFGGIPATAALARTAANIRAGGSAPLASVIHSLFILIAIVSLAPLLAYIPMASMAALLLMVAWNMSEAKHFVRVIKIAPRDDIIALLTCFSLTIIFDMTIAVGVGMSLAAILFIRRSISLTESRFVHEEHERDASLPKEIAIYDINGPLFFGSAQKAMQNITNISPEVRVVVFDMSRVSMIDMSAIIAMESVVKNLSAKNVGLVILNLQSRMILKLRRSGLRTIAGKIAFARTMDEAVEEANKML
jgi:SulP family sulfate permease